MPEIQPDLLGLSREIWFVMFCGANETRTRNPLLAKQVRYQLRHGPAERSASRTRKADRAPALAAEEAG